VGVLGGFERWNDQHRGIVKVANALRSLNLPGVYVATVENHRQRVALESIKGFVEHDREPAASHQPRVILYGQSWGGAAVISIARELQASGIRVQLTIQVDSIGMKDGLVPPNVDNAVNLFQHDFPGLDGRTEIRAEDPLRTRILENKQYFYRFRSYDTLSQMDGSWVRKTFGGSHAKMELDESVCAHVEALILAAVRNEL
jgi:hypothetical protein